MGGGGGKVPGVYMGWWGSIGSQPQKGVISYSMSANRQRPLAGTLHAAFFNTFRRVRGQILYVAPPLVAAYYGMSWAIERNHYLNSKPGRAEASDEE
ncbi:putative ubiquinol-cytochrome C reductase complex subunit UcrQ [Xylona heveae TC161]|uniref:Cytochrome b-c1 complex subunit 8 n=1 Tax=Xylona heveae (strain CBS 132557 / TC161) TaxID=1328760 RepID=A0A165HKR2_XYLHT|nr:putative ubiquinol-cytochrome C reductase complex subunit UcrQ [Xylona heveae TC161]KZF23660.1 putative ubiquinol-cytochrome C reductase complex subunit UcrQ [Xylona heveae TC161]